MLPLPDDEVTLQLQKLVDQCCHGASYCKQVLSLYQLSKVTVAVDDTIALLRPRRVANHLTSCVFAAAVVQELQCSFGQICREEPSLVLEKLLLSEQPERFRKAQAFIRAQGLSADSVAKLVSASVVRALLPPAQELQPGEMRGSGGCVEVMQEHDWF